MRVAAWIPALFLHFLLIKSSVCFLGQAVCSSSTNSNMCNTSEKPKTDSEIVAAENAVRNNVGITETRVMMSRYHLGTENSRIYKERSSKEDGNNARNVDRNAADRRVRQNDASADGSNARQMTPTDAPASDRRAAERRQSARRSNERMDTTRSRRVNRRHLERTIRDTRLETPSAESIDRASSSERVQLGRRTVTERIPSDRLRERSAYERRQQRDLSQRRTQTLSERRERVPSDELKQREETISSERAERTTSERVARTTSQSLQEHALSRREERASLERVQQRMVRDTRQRREQRSSERREQRRQPERLEQRVPSERQSSIRERLRTNAMQQQTLSERREERASSESMLSRVARDTRERMPSQRREERISEQRNERSTFERQQQRVASERQQRRALSERREKLQRLPEKQSRSERRQERALSEGFQSPVEQETRERMVRAHRSVDRLVSDRRDPNAQLERRERAQPTRSSSNDRQNERRESLSRRSERTERTTIRRNSNNRLSAQRARRVTRDSRQNSRDNQIVAERRNTARLNQVSASRSEERSTARNDYQRFVDSLRQTQPIRERVSNLRANIQTRDRLETRADSSHRDRVSNQRIESRLSQTIRDDQPAILRSAARLESRRIRLNPSERVRVNRINERRAGDRLVEFRRVVERRDRAHPESERHSDRLDVTRKIRSLERVQERRENPKETSAERRIVQSRRNNDIQEIAGQDSRAASRRFAAITLKQFNTEEYLQEVTSWNGVNVLQTIVFALITLHAVTKQVDMKTKLKLGNGFTNILSGFKHKIM